MTSKKKIILTSAIVIVLSIYAFTAGAKLRSWQDAPYSANSTASIVPRGNVLKLTPGQPSYTDGKVYNANEADSDLVSTIVDSIKQMYVEPITPERETKMARGAASGIISSLENPDSRFLDPDQKKALDDANAGKFHGIGAIFTIKEDKGEEYETSKLIIISPMPGSPAKKAGLLPGDSITHINNKWVVTHNPLDEAEFKKLEEDVRNKDADILEYYNALKETEKRIKDGMVIPDAVKMLSSDSSGILTIMVERAGQPKPLEFKIETSPTEIDPVTASTLKNGIAYIRISQFNPAAAEQFRDEFNKVKNGRAGALVIDLRENPGGSLDSVTSIIGDVTGGGIIGVIKQKNGRKTIEAPKSKKTALPIVVLVDAGTASVAELAAGVLREKSSAYIIGAKTFGDGTIQTPLILSDGSAAVITTGEMLTPLGISFNKTGILPSKVVNQSQQGDSQLDEAVNHLSARPGKV